MPDPEVPSHLQYGLSRAQRLVPHLRVWGPWNALLLVALLAFFLARAAACIFARDMAGAAVFGGLALVVFVVCRGLVVGLLDVLLVRVRRMDVVVEENAAGILLGAERWYLFLDGITSIRKYRDDVWTLQHFNGSVLNIAASAITEEQMAYIRAAMERGHTQEGMRAVVERGRRIEEIRKTERKG